MGAGLLFGFAGPVIRKQPVARRAFPPRQKLVPRFDLLFTQSLPRPRYNEQAPSEGGATLGTESLPGYYRRLPKVLISSTEHPY